jgi:hypothetical protein
MRPACVRICGGSCRFLLVRRPVSQALRTGPGLLVVPLAFLFYFADVGELISIFQMPGEDHAFQSVYFGMDRSDAQLLWPSHGPHIGGPISPNAIFPLRFQI